MAIPKNMTELRAQLKDTGDTKNISWNSLCHITAEADEEIRKQVNELNHKVENMALNMVDKMKKTERGDY